MCPRSTKSHVWQAVIDHGDKAVGIERMEGIREDDIGAWFNRIR